MRLLAIDEGSKATGLAFFDGSDRPAWTRALTPAAAWPWRRRMRWICDALRGVLETNGLLADPPDVIAIEDAVVSEKNPRMGVAVSKCRGYLIAHLDSIYGLELPIIDVSPGKVRAAVGISAFSGRVHSKDRYKVVAQYLGLPATISEDEADAACVGLAALAQLREENWHAIAR
ncbi:MAG TPA: hypothetical protein VIN37_02830 [Candidatus Limnocylindria bacterium]